MAADPATVAVTTWLIFSTAAQNGLVQSEQAIMYRDAESCARAAHAILVTKQEVDAWFTRDPHCTTRRPVWWWPAGTQPGGRLP